jgi:hypothetical protein
LYYNDDIDQEECNRRFDSLCVPDVNPEINQAVADCNAWNQVPWQEGWRRRRKSHAGFPKEWKHRIPDEWDDKLEALKDLHTWTLERRRKAF